MSPPLVTLTYIAAAVLFILSLSGLSHQETASRGNILGSLGMLIAFLVTAAVMQSGESGGLGLLILVILPAILIGGIVAARVKMTSMPQLVAILHSFVGLAAVLVGIATYLDTTHGNEAREGISWMIHGLEIVLGVGIGSITCTGSIIACLKLQGVITGSPLLLPGRHVLNLAMLAACAWLGYLFLQAGTTSPEQGLRALLILAGLTGILGLHLVLAIGGADMPVVVSMLNSYSGWAAAAAGFMLSNDLLIIVGALVGSSGAILSYMMCRGMNRSLAAVILGGFGTGDSRLPTGGDLGEVAAIEVEELVEQLRNASRVVIIPGYGMAVAKAQHALAGITELLRSRNTTVHFGIHPVAGRLPGHMNVLLAEASVPYDIVLEMNEINPQFPEVDVVLVVGANDIVNPSAQDDPSSPIAGMPVLEVWKAARVVVMKRSMASGYAGVQNPLFTRDNTRMLFGDARENAEKILGDLRS